MPYLSRDEIKEIVARALKVVADFEGDIEGYDFSHLEPLHMQEFIDAIARFLAEKFIRVALSISKLKELGTMTALLNYIDDTQAYYGSDKPLPAPVAKLKAKPKRSRR